MKNGRPKGSKKEVQRRVESRLPVIAELYLQGYSQKEIADQLGVSQPTIGKNIQRIREDWLESSRINFDERAAIELAKLDRLERKAWEGYERSCKDEVTNLDRIEESDDGGERRVNESRVKGQAGDSSFLAIIERCIDKRLRMFNMMAPETAILVPPGDSNEQTNPWLLLAKGSPYHPEVVEGTVKGELNEYKPGERNGDET